MMKKLTMLFGFLVLLIVPLLSQDTIVAIPPVNDVPVIPDWLFLTNNFGILMGTFLGIAAIASFVGEALIRLFKTTITAWKVVIVMILAIVLSFVGSVVNLGYLAATPWWQTILWGALSGAAAAGLKSGNILFFKSIIEFVIGLILSKEPRSVK